MSNQNNNDTTYRERIGFVLSAPNSATDALPEEVTQAYLAIYTDDQLEGRRDHYEREALFERDPETRDALKGEVERTEGELSRRKNFLREEANRAFAP